MARVTIEDCLKNVPSRFALVHMAAQRVRQIREGSDFLIKSSKNEDVVTALREIAANRVRMKINDEQLKSPAKRADESLNRSSRNNDGQLKKT
ncbi:MAG: DNA-directed RNA polymerase subunit omega [Desulfamplus sp.]|nr:DNA-directed RNA polymerase subunit omega [Desulfamplus sp.]